MRWFARDGRPNESVSLALAVGELKAEVAALQRDVARLKVPPAPPKAEAPVLTPRLRAEITAQSFGSPELQRHQESVVRDLVAQGMDEADIIAAIRRGS